MAASSCDLFELYGVERVEADDEAEHGCLGCELEEGGNVGRLGEDDGKMGVIDDVG